MSLDDEAPGVMWGALIKKSPDPANPDATATSLSGRIRHYLRAKPHRTAKQIADDLGMTQGQAATALYYMEQTGRIIAALDDSTERNRLAKHYSVRN